MNSNQESGNSRAYGKRVPAKSLLKKTPVQVKQNHNVAVKKVKKTEKGLVISFTKL